MNLYNLFKKVGFLVLLLTFVSSTANAQFFVNNQTGNDANSGLVGSPKKTVASALIAAPTGSTISVAATGINYTEANITVAGASTYTFVSTGGTPVFVNAALIVGTGTAAGGKGTLTFTGPFNFAGLTLQNGTVTNGNQITIATGKTVTRTDLGSITAGQLAFAGTALFVYDDVSAGAKTITTGLEFPVATNVATNLTTLSTGGVLTLKLDQNRTINGILTTVAGNLTNLGGFTLNIAGASVAHALGGNVTNGTLAFAMTGATTVGGAVALPNVTASKTTAGITVLTLTAAPSVLSLTATGNASITATAVATVNVAANTTDVITNSGTGIITMTSAATVNGNVLLNATGLKNANGNCQINFGLAAPITINGNVTNSAGILFGAAGARANMGLITFPVQAITINGNVTINGTLSGAVNAADNYASNGDIRFTSTTQLITITGTVSNSATSTATGTPVGSTGSTNFRLRFGSTSGNVIATGGFSNSSSIAAAGATSANNGQIIFLARTTGTIGTAAKRTGAVTNTSTSAVASNGTINFGTAATVLGTFFGTTISSSGAAGGDILFGNHALNVTGNISNSRTAAGADILVPVGAATVTHTLAGAIINSGAATISIDLTGSDIVNLTGALQNSGAGTTIFPVAGAGLINLGSVNVSAGTVTVPATHSVNIVIAGMFTVSGGTVNFLGAAAGDQVTCVGFNWTNGTLNFGARGVVSTTGATNTLGGATTSPAFGSAVTALTLLQPVPNVNQILSVGTADPVYPGPFTVSNAAVLPAPYVTINSINTAINANLYVTNTVTFSTGGAVVNTVRLDNAWLNVGKRGVGGGTGIFENTTGYSTINGGRVMMSGNGAVQTVNVIAPVAGATFGNFGIDNDDVNGAAAADVDFKKVCTFVGNFYLAKGQINPNLTVVGGVTFKSPAPSYPVTVFRTEGFFLTNRPTLTAGSRINVTYFGTDKATALEIPLGAATLQNLNVSTTNGAKAGFGVVTMGGAATVNGTLTIDANQSLYTGANILTLAGASAVVNGNLVDNGAAAPRVQLARATGTAFTGSGSVPSLQVNAGSAGNTFSGAGLVSQGFGTDGVWGGAGGAADNFTTDGNIVYAGGAASSLAVTFSGAGPHVALITNAAGGTLTLNSNAVASGAVTVSTGTIALGANTLTLNNAAFGITGAAGAVTGTGTLKFANAAAVITVGVAAATIAANVSFTGAAATFNTNNLRFNGNVTLGTATPTVNTFTIPNGLTLTAGGSKCNSFWSFCICKSCNRYFSFSKYSSKYIINLDSSCCRNTNSRKFECWW